MENTLTTISLAMGTFIIGAVIGYASRGEVSPKGKLQQVDLTTFHETGKLPNRKTATPSTKNRKLASSPDGSTSKRRPGRPRKDARDD